MQGFIATRGDRMQVVEMFRLPPHVINLTIREPGRDETWMRSSNVMATLDYLVGLKAQMIKDGWKIQPLKTL